MACFTPKHGGRSVPYSHWGSLHQEVGCRRSNHLITYERVECAETLTVVKLTSLLRCEHPLLWIPKALTNIVCFSKIVSQCELEIRGHWTVYRRITTEIGLWFLVHWVKWTYGKGTNHAASYIGQRNTSMRGQSSPERNIGNGGAQFQCTLKSDRVWKPIRTSFAFCFWWTSKQSVFIHKSDLCSPTLFSFFYSPLTAIFSFIPCLCF